MFPTEETRYKLRKFGKFQFIYFCLLNFKDLFNMFQRILIFFLNIFFFGSENVGRDHHTSVLRLNVTKKKTSLYIFFCIILFFSYIIIIFCILIILLIAQRMSDETIIRLFGALADNKCLETLSMANTGLSDRHLEALTNAVSENTTLRSFK